MFKILKAYLTPGINNFLKVLYNTKSPNASVLCDATA